MPAALANPAAQRSFARALAASLVFHAIALAWWPPLHEHPLPADGPLEVRLAVPTQPVAPAPAVAGPPPPQVEAPQPRAERPAPSKRLRQEAPRLVRREAAPMVPEPAPARAPPAPVETPAVAPSAASVPAEPAAPAAAPAATPPKVAAVAPALLTAPEYAAASLRNPKPPYPASARRDGEQGTVVLKVMVTPEGAAGHVELAQSSGSAALDRAALDTVKRWRFVPARRGDQAVEGWVRVPVEFRLEQP